MRRAIRAFVVIRRMVVVGDEAFEFAGDVDWGEKELFWWVNTSGWAVCRVLSALDVLDMHDNVCCPKELCNAFENLVDARVSATTPLPPLDHSLVVSVYREVLPLSSWAEVRDCSSEEFEADGFCPPDVSLVCVPPRKEFPGPPPRSDDNPNAGAGACI